MRKRTLRKHERVSIADKPRFLFPRPLSKQRQIHLAKIVDELYDPFLPC